MTYFIFSVVILFVLRNLSYGIYEITGQNIMGGIFVILWGIVSLWALWGLLY